MAWIELHQTLREHKKMFACADDLGVKRTEMIGILVSLWLWALDNAQDGSLAGVSDKTIARVCDFPEKKAGKLVEVLRKNRFLEKDGDHYVIHDWYDYAGKLMEKREKDRARKQKSNKNGKDSSGNSDGTAVEETQDFQRNSNGIPTDEPGNSRATVPNLTVPNLTVPNLTVPYLTNTGDDISGGGDSARASEQERASIGLKQEEFPHVTSNRVKQAVSDAEAMFRKWRGGKRPSAFDCRMTFLCTVNEGCCDLLDYAFEQAHLAGKEQDWRYIGGILHVLRTRNIKTVEQARKWDQDRPDLTGESLAAIVENMLANRKPKEAGK